MAKGKSKLGPGPCRLCGGKSIMMDRHTFHLSFAIVEDDSTVEYNFLNSGAIMCMGCCLILPIYDDNPKEIEYSLEQWNKK